MMALSFFFFIRFFLPSCPTCIVPLHADTHYLAEPPCRLEQNGVYYIGSQKVEIRIGRVKYGKT